MSIVLCYNVFSILFFDVLSPPPTAATSSSSVACIFWRRWKRRRSVSSGGRSVSSGGRSVSSGSVPSGGRRMWLIHCCRWGRVGSLLLLQAFSRTVVLCVKMLTIKSHNCPNTDSTLIILLSDIIGMHIMCYFYLCKYILSNSTLCIV